MCHKLLKGSETKENSHEETGSQSRVQGRGGAKGWLLERSALHKSAESTTCPRVCWIGGAKNTSSVERQHLRRKRKQSKKL